MIIQIRAKDVSLTQNAREHIQSAIEVFQKFGLELTSVHCNLKSEKKGINVEFDIHIAHAQPVVINQSDDDLDAAIDLAIDRASKALRRLHTKMTEHSSTSLRDLEAIDA
jgi:putative sigma-54 modulation protein